MSRTGAEPGPTSQLRQAHCVLIFSEATKERERPRNRLDLTDAFLLLRLSLSQFQIPSFAT